MTFALITTLQQGDHYTAPWYIAVPIIVVALGLTIWRRRRGGQGEGRLAAPAVLVAAVAEDKRFELLRALIGADCYSLGYPAPHAFLRADA